LVQLVWLLVPTNKCRSGVLDTLMAGRFTTGTPVNILT